ncbi:hypothetical protein [Vibrio phage VP4B]|uniref:Uncharacterized protein n=1 Tax=Vibrio phage VP4B TaxID=1262540 RepID=V9M0L3_9CAUD|nr:hypothetical protein FDJ61_gp074 [Vibrio phage VP4B]AGB07188.1 hypothetical protein [Vibrio phage VP4B]
MCECNPSEELVFNEEQKNVWQKAYPLITMEGYQGPFAYLDLTLTWFCPRCCDLSKPLLLNREKTVLYCDSHPHTCEYTYANFETRKAKRTFLSSQYRLPLSLEECRDNVLKRLELDVLGMKQQRDRLGTRIEEKQEHIIQLKNTWK